MRTRRGSFDNGVLWDKVPEAPEHPGNWVNPVVPPNSTENVGGRFVDGVPGWIEGRVGRISRRLMGGTWSLPRTREAAERLVKMVRRMKGGDEPVVGRSDVSVLMYPLIGDDELFDDLDRVQGEYFRSCGRLVEARVRKLAKQDEKDFNKPGEKKVVDWVAENI